MHLTSTQTTLAASSRTHWLTVLAVACFSLWNGAAYGLSPPMPVLVLGDSLSAAYGLPREAGWVHLLANKVRISTVGKYAVVNTSISGETTAGGAQRLPALLAQHKPAVVVIELGGNDALRGLALSQTQTHFTHMVQTAKASGAKVLLIPMQMPPNYGAAYTRGFEAIYPAVAKQHGAALAPFILKDFADKPTFFQRDRIHPTAEAQPLMLATVWPALSILLK